MTNLEMKHVLISILEILKQELGHLDREHGYLIAVSETLESNPEFASLLREHEFYDPSLRPTLQKVRVLNRNIDALIQRLMEEK